MTDPAPRHIVRVRVADFELACGCRSAGECMHNLGAEVEALSHLVDLFADEIKKKLHTKYRRGYNGWDDPNSAQFIRNSLVNHVERGPGQEVDVAALAAILWNLGTSPSGR